MIEERLIDSKIIKKYVYDMSLKFLIFKDICN